MSDWLLVDTEALFQRIRMAVPADSPIYLVGGAVRDILLRRPIHDLDFVLPEHALQTGRQVAEILGAAFYPLDAERDTARLFYSPIEGVRQSLDFTSLRGPDLESDLRGRDFTINAIALDIRSPDKMIDPLGGVADLKAGLIRACSDDALVDDPLRILRAVRLAAAFEYQILPETRQLIRHAIGLLPGVSPERLRDELFRMLEGRQVATAIQLLDYLGALPIVLPELVALKGITQSPPHIDDVWTHSLEVVRKLVSVLSVLSLEYDPELSANFARGLLSVRLGRFRQQIHDHLAAPLSPERSLIGLLMFAALYHDAGKPETRCVEAGGRIRFFEHEQVSARLLAHRARKLHLSNDEIDRLRTIARNHMRPLLLAQAGIPPTNRAIYKFFRACGPAGVDVCLLSLADTLATYGHTLPTEVWTNHLDVVRVLLESVFERPEQAVSPPALISGHDLMDTFGIEPGPRIGQLLEAVREAQAAGLVSDRQGALGLASQLISSD